MRLATLHPEDCICQKGHPPKTEFHHFFLTIAHVVLSVVPPHARPALYATLPPMLMGSGLCLRSVAVTDLGAAGVPAARAGRPSDRVRAASRRHHVRPGVLFARRAQRRRLGRGRTRVHPLLLIDAIRLITVISSQGALEKSGPKNGL